MSYSETPPPDLHLGPVLQQSWMVFRADAPRLIPMAAVAAAPTLIYWFGLGINPETEVADAAFGMRLFIAMLVSFFAQTMICFGVIATLRGRPYTLADAFSHCFARLLPLTLTALIVVAATVASLLVVVGPFVLMCIWYVWIPVCIAEDLNPKQTLQRAALLSGNNRLKLFVLVLIEIATQAVMITALVTLQQIAPGGIGAVLAEGVVGAVNCAVSAVLAATAYVHLRSGIEASLPKRIGAVFD